MRRFSLSSVAVALTVLFVAPGSAAAAPPVGAVAVPGTVVDVQSRQWDDNRPRHYRRHMGGGQWHGPGRPPHWGGRPPHWAGGGPHRPPHWHRPHRPNPSWWVPGAIITGAMIGSVWGGSGGYYDSSDCYRYGYNCRVYREPRRYRVDVSEAHVRWCYNRYRSYRAWDNKFQPYNGPRQQCWSPYS